MDLRQRDPFERKFAELVIRFRSLGLLLILILLGINTVKMAPQFSGYLAEMSSHLHTFSEFIAYHGLDPKVLTTHWNLHQFALASLVVLVAFTPLLKKKWIQILALLGVSASIKGVLFLHQSCSDSSWVVWAFPLACFVLAIVFKVGKLKWASFLATWGLGLSLAFVQVSQLSQQLGVDHFVLFPQWLIALLVVAGAILFQQLMQVNDELKEVKVLTPASVVVKWYSQNFKLYMIVWTVIIVAIALTMIPALGWEMLISIYFLMAAFQLAVLHLVLFPMMINVLGFFPKKS